MASCTAGNSPAAAGRWSSQPVDGLVGRDELIAEVLGAVTSPAGPVILLLRGETGAGHTLLLSALAERLRAMGTSVHHVACLPTDHLTAYLLAYRLVMALTSSAHPPEGRTSGRQAWSLDGANRGHNVPGGSGPAVFDLLASTLHARAPAVVLIDDAQYADRETAALMRSLMPILASSGGKLIVSLSPVRSGWAPLDQPDAATAVGAVDLPPLTYQEIARLLTYRLHAVPGRSLVSRLHRLSNGNAAAAAAAIDLFQAAGSIRVLLGQANLVPDVPDPVLPDADRLIRALRGLGGTTWQVAKALSILEPMGAQTPALIAAASELPAAVVHDALRYLVESGFVTGPVARGSAAGYQRHPAEEDDSDGLGVRRSYAAGWAFRIPLVAVAAQARLGPYERRAVSAAAVQSFWDLGGGDGWAADDPAWSADVGGAERQAYLADRIVDAGMLVDRARAACDLLTVAERLRSAHARQVSRWLRAAADLADNRATRAKALARHSVAAFRTGDRQAAASAVSVLMSQHTCELVGPELRQEIRIAEITALAAAGDVFMLTAVAERHRSRAAEPAGDDFAAVAAFALCLLGRWPEALKLLNRTGLDRRPTPIAQHLGAMCRASALLLMDGDSAAVYQIAKQPFDQRLSPPLVLELTIQLYGCLLGMGSLRRATALAQERGVPVAQFSVQDTFLAQFLSGAWPEAMESARSLMAARVAATRAPISVLAHARCSTMLLARGWPTRARAMLDSAWSDPAPHLLAAEKAAIHQLLGEPELAQRALRHGLASAAKHGYIFGTEPLWAALAVAEAQSGQSERAAARLAELDRQAVRGSEQARLMYLCSCVTVIGLCPQLRLRLPDLRLMVDEAIALARSEGQPFEMACTLLAVASADPSHGPGRQQRLLEAYELFGQLDALLWRFRARTALRDARVPVPDRRTSTEENERLLAILVTEGLSNRQLAAALGVSQGSVASRLTRLFQHTGLRSRVELATAMLTGNYP